MPTQSLAHEQRKAQRSHTDQQEPEEHPEETSEVRAENLDWWCLGRSRKDIVLKGEHKRQTGRPASQTPTRGSERLLWLPYRQDVNRALAWQSWF